VDAPIRKDGGGLEAKASDGGYRKARKVVPPHLDTSDRTFAESLVGPSTIGARRV
jgi:hypothetical protein